MTFSLDLSTLFAAISHVTPTYHPPFLHNRRGHRITHRAKWPTTPSIIQGTQLSRNDAWLAAAHDNAMHRTLWSIRAINDEPCSRFGSRYPFFRLHQALLLWGYNQQINRWMPILLPLSLTSFRHWDWDKRTDMLQTTFRSEFLRLKFHWNISLKVKLIKIVIFGSDNGLVPCR